MMGAWGAGLYSGDFALDLRSTIAAVARLPLDGEKICETLRQSEPGAAENSKNEDHTTFWLVLADQFHKRGIECADVTAKALNLIDSGADAAIHRELGMSQPNLRKRAKSLDDLRRRLRDEPPALRRGVLKKPQPLILSVGDIYAFPTGRGQPVNPYVHVARDGRYPHWYQWSQDAWAAVLVVDRGRAFEYLAWYTLAVTQRESGDKPTLSDLWETPWTLRSSGTCTPTHFKRLRLEPLGAVSISRDAIESRLGKLVPGISAAVLDVSIANYMDVVTKNPNSPSHNPRIERAASLELRQFATAPPR
jgi:hypothetical protein